MSQQETEKVARAWFDALDRSDYPAAMGCLAEDIVWANLPKVAGISDIVPWLGACRGVAEVAASFAARDAVCQPKIFRLVDLVVQDDVAFATVHDQATVKATGVDFDIEFATRLEVAAGRIVHWKSYCDPSPVIVAFRADLDGRLLAAVERGDLEAVDHLLAGGADVDARDAATGLTALMRASCQADEAVVRRLLDAGADVLTTDSKTGATALHKACQGGSVAVARLLVQRGAFIDAVTPTMGHTPVMDALWYKWPELVAFLVDAGADLELGTHYGFSLRQHLAFELEVNSLGKEKLVEIEQIIRSRQATDAEVINRQAVMAALRDGDAAAAEAAIAAGAEVNTVAPRVNSFFDGHTPLLVAARDGRTEVVRRLLEAGADTAVVDWTFKGSPLHKATYNGSPEIVRLLAAQPGIDLDVQGPINGYTPLHDALWHGYAECAEILLDSGARTDLVGHDGKTPADVAAAVLGADAPVTERLRASAATGGAAR